MKTKTILWDAADHLKTKEDMAAYIACALEDGDPALIATALGDIARAQGMTKQPNRRPFVRSFPTGRGLPRLHEQTL